MTTERDEARHAKAQMELRWQAAEKECARLRAVLDGKRDTVTAWFEAEHRRGLRERIILRAERDEARHAKAQMELRWQAAEKECARLRAVLDGNLGTVPTADDELAGAAVRKFSEEAAWLSANRDQYLGKWVALDGGILLAAGSSAREVFAAVADHVPTALVVKVRQSAPFAGW